MFQWLVSYWQQLRREMTIPSPPFRACKRTAAIMNGLWYGRFTVDEARKRAADWGFAPEVINQMIAEATKPPSYWSQQGGGA